MALDSTLSNIFGQNFKLNSDLLTVNIKNRQNVVFQSQAAAVSSENEIGPFDVLPQHANFISLIQNKIIIHQKNTSDFEIPIGTGILKVWQNQVNVYLDVFSSLKE